VHREVVRVSIATTWVVTHHDISAFLVEDFGDALSYSEAIHVREAIKYFSVQT